LLEYKRNILEKYPPCFDLWFLHRFPDPAAWYEARNLFSRSAAVWSSVGHVVGLGDRHGENLLLDVKSGECVHVDFDCLFDKGLTLAKPEIVPFRLTPNMVRALGPTGYEGPFRSVMELTLDVLRRHRDTLLSVLEPFLRDPTVGWDRLGKAQQGDTSLDGCRTVAAHRKGAILRGEGASEALVVIEERLRGVYNLRIVDKQHSAPGGAKKRPSSSALKGAPAETQDRYKDPKLPLAIQGQVQRLLEEATSVDNLSQMYVGWMPWM
jgi:serine/threonine-protein kinase ATR